MMRTAPLWISIAFAAGCANPSPYTCTTSQQCTRGSSDGVCTNGYCAFPDSACDSGLRFESNAGASLGGTCVMLDAGMPDAAVCGEHGQACCTEGAACTLGAECESNTCTSCVSDVVFGRRFMCVLQTSGAVWCSGMNRNGQLGFGLAGEASATPMHVRDATSTPITDAIAIGAGRDAACVVRTGGSVWCWGQNDQGQIGNGTTIAMAPHAQPAAVQVKKTDNTPLTGIVQVAGGYQHTCARDMAGGVWCWGKNANGQLGDGTTTPRSLAAPVLDAPAGAALTGALDLMVVAERACVRKTGDAIWCWGRNNDGEIADGTQMARSSPVLSQATHPVSLGMYHTCSIKPDTTVVCWGWNGHGRMGNGKGQGYSDNTRYTTPQPMLAAVGGAALTGVVELATGAATCLRTSDGRVLCTGDSQYGQHGPTSSTVPVPLLLADDTPVTGVDRLLVGHTHVCARRTSGAYLCWGRNTDGELGDGSFENRPYPTALATRCP